MTFGKFVGSSVSADAASSLKEEEEFDPHCLVGESSLAVGKNASLTLGPESVTVLEDQTTSSIPYFNVLWADCTPDDITINYAEPTSKDAYTVATIHYSISQERKQKAEIWVARLMDLAYGQAQRNKRIKVLVNPFGGKGRAKTLYYNEAEPIFTAARCQIDAEETKYQGHAIEIAEKIDVDAYDVIAPCSGDGLPYEVFNGLGKKENAGEALSKVAVAHIPCGTGNAMSWNLYGTGSVSLAAISIVKGLRTPLDLVSISQGDRRTLSFLSQSFGIVADSDLGTENIRWMGSARFTYGFLVRLLGKTVYPCDLAVKVDIGDKESIKEHYRAELQKQPATRTRFDPESQSSTLPPLKYGTVADPIPDDWTHIPYENLGNFYAGNMAYMAADANFFPASLPSDGYMDLVTIAGDIGRMAAIQMMMNVERGTLFDMEDVNVRKTSAYRITPRDKDGIISVDGEKVPFEPFQAEVHQGLGTVLSKSGHLYEAKGVA
ncbi:sphinganine kinase lcb4 [Arachnomyces sp. PD_36]|nr:sphinganine kinase lcb4 [Arachnomyces sp. PD_36]